MVRHDWDRIADRLQLMAAQARNWKHDQATWDEREVARRELERLAWELDPDPDKGEHYD